MTVNHGPESFRDWFEPRLRSGKGCVMQPFFVSPLLPQSGKEVAMLRQAAKQTGWSFHSKMFLKFTEYQRNGDVENLPLESGVLKYNSFLL